jgi:hypothetical protein
MSWQPKVVKIKGSIAGAAFNHMDAVLSYILPTLIAPDVVLNAQGVFVHTWILKKV